MQRNIKPMKRTTEPRKRTTKPGDPYAKFPIYYDMVRKLAWSFHNTTGIDYQELESEAAMVCLEAMKDIDKTKSNKPSTYLYKRIQNHLINHCKAERLRTHIPFSHFGNACEEDGDENMSVMESGVFGSVQPVEHFEIEIFSGSAKELISIILNISNRPAEYITRTKGKCQTVEVAEEIDFNQSPKNIRGQIIEHLRNEGWPYNQIWATLSEVKRIINQN